MTFTSGAMGSSKSNRLFQKAGLILVGLLCTSSALGGDSFSLQLGQQYQRSLTYMLRNISSPDASPGSVIASPSKSDPNYFFHWIRDAALVMKTVAVLYEKSSQPEDKALYSSLLKDFVTFSRKNQKTSLNGMGLGEPRFLVSGDVELSPWARPQNDGPALRAITLTQFAQRLLDEGQREYVVNNLYSYGLPPNTVIKTDLEYVAHRWRDTSFDVWEETRGQHFYNRLVTRKALLDGAQLADRLQDGAAASFYRLQAQDVEKDLARFWDPKAGHIQVTLQRDGGINYKSSGIDSVVILGVLHGLLDDNQAGAMGPTDSRVLATAQKTIDAFEMIYPLNQSTNPKMAGLATAIGRYPEDRYDGVGTSGQGNPWFLATHGFAELYYLVANRLERQGFLKLDAQNRKVLQDLGVKVFPLGIWKTTFVRNDPLFENAVSALRSRGDDFMRRSLYHMKQENGSMSEQFNRVNGYMQGARDLTWSYASYLTAFWAR